MTKAKTSITRELIQQAAKRTGINASIGRTEKGGTYHPDKNALGRSVPIEWLENFASDVVQSVAKIKQTYTSGHCKELDHKDGCQKDDLQCGYPDCDKRQAPQPLQSEPVALVPGPNAWKDWCARWFGTDCDDGYLAKAIFELPEMAQKFKSSQTPQAQVPTPFTDREIELIDGMIEVQLDHAMRCDNIQNRAMADKQKGWDMERAELLRKIKENGIGGKQ